MRSTPGKSRDMADTEHGYRSTQPDTNGVSVEAYNEGSRAGRASGEVGGHERPNREQQAGLEAAHHEEEHCSNNGDNGDDVYDKVEWARMLRELLQHDPRISEEDRLTEELLDPRNNGYDVDCPFIDRESTSTIREVFLERRKRSAPVKYPSGLWFPDDGLQMFGVDPEVVTEVRKAFERRGGYDALEHPQLHNHTGGLENHKEGADGSANLGSRNRHHSGPVDLATRHSEDRSLNDYTEREIEEHLRRRRRPLEEYTAAELEEHLRRRREREITPQNKTRDDSPGFTDDRPAHQPSDGDDIPSESVHINIGSHALAKNV